MESMRSVPRGLANESTFIERPATRMKWRMPSEVGAWQADSHIRNFSAAPLWSGRIHLKGSPIVGPAIYRARVKHRELSIP